MMSPNELRDEMMARIYSTGIEYNVYCEKLGILDKFESIKKSNLYVLEDFMKKLFSAFELIEKYKLDGKDLNNEITFEELRKNVDLIFKPKGFFSFF